MAKGLWEKLQNLYEEESMLNKIFLWKKFHNLKMTEDSSLQEHLCENPKLKKGQNWVF